MNADITIPVVYLVCAAAVIFFAFTAVVVVSLWKLDRQQKPRYSRHR